MIVSKQNLTGKLIHKQSIQGKINKATEYIEIYPEIQSKTITPTKQTQTILPDENIYALSEVTVNPIPNNYIEPQGQKEITDNGTYDVTNFASANVEIEIGKLTNEEYTEANDDLDDILEGNTPTIIYPPDWSEIGYDETPQQVINNFNYSKEIKNNWDENVVILKNRFYNDRSLIYMPLVGTSKATDMQSMFYGCTSLTSIPKLDTSNVTNMRTMFRDCTSLTTIPLLNTSEVTNMNQMFYYCKSLTSIPLLDTSKVTNVGYMFQACTGLKDVPVFDFSSVVSGNSSRAIFTGCTALSDESLNNILKICINMTSITSNKTLKYVMDLTSEQATICQGLSNYQAFLDAGWTTGY